MLYKSAARGGVHSRIIWSCAWSDDDKYLATASRDRKVIFTEIFEVFFLWLLPVLLFFSACSMESGSRKQNCAVGTRDKAWISCNGGWFLSIENKQVSPWQICFFWWRFVARILTLGFRRTNFWRKHFPEKKQLATIKFHSKTSSKNSFPTLLLFLIYHICCSQKLCLFSFYWLTRQSGSQEPNPPPSLFSTTAPPSGFRGKSVAMHGQIKNRRYTVFSTGSGQGAGALKKSV